MLALTVLLPCKHITKITIPYFVCYKMSVCPFQNNSGSENLDLSYKMDLDYFFWKRIPCLIAELITLFGVLCRERNPPYYSQINIVTDCIWIPLFPASQGDYVLLQGKLLC